MLLADDPIPTSRCCTHNKGIPAGNFPTYHQRHVHHVLSVLIPLQACALKLDLQSMPSGDLLGIPVMMCHEGAVRTKEAPAIQVRIKGTFKFYEVHKPQ